MSASKRPAGYDSRALTPRGLADEYCAEEGFDRQWKSVVRKRIEAKAVRFRLRESLKTVGKAEVG